MNSYHYDGHGINISNGPRKGDRVFTGQRRHADNGNGYVLDNEERERVGTLFAAAPEMLAELEFLATQWKEFRTGEPINGADFVQWFAECLPRIRAIVRKAKVRRKKGGAV
jgi:hypothetical protein